MVLLLKRIVAIVPLTLLSANAFATIVGFDSFSYPDGPLNNRNGGGGWNRVGGLAAWSGGAIFPTVSNGALYTGNDAGAFRNYGADVQNSSFQSTGIVFLRATLKFASALPVYTGLSSMDYGPAERVFFGFVTNGNLGISEPGYDRALTAVSPAANAGYTLVGVLDYTHRKLSLFVNPSSADFYDVADGSSSATVTKPFQSWFNWSIGLRLQSGGGGANVAFDNITVATLPADVGLQGGGFLHTGGVAMLAGNSEELLLRSVNLGSWLWPELWMMGSPNLSAYPGADDFEKLNAAILDVLGGDTNLTAQALGAMRSNFVTAADIIFLKNLGFNSVRVPFHYELFYQVTNAAANFPTNGYDLNTGFYYFDSLLALCSTNGIYVVPDMHGVPGGKDYSFPGNVYTNASNHALFLHVWTRIAAHFATNTWIGGYDLINEPVNSSSYLIPGTLLSVAYSDAKNAIRSVDTNHMLICEGDWWATALGQINTTGWSDPNVSYSDHRYGDVLPLGTDRKAVCVGQNVPLWMGEFGYNSPHWINFASANFEQPDALSAGGKAATIREGHAYWSYKAPQFYVPVENAQTAGWNVLKAYWAGNAARPSVTNAFTWLLEYAQGTLFSNCMVHPEVLDGLTRPNASFASQHLPYRTGLTIPGRIPAANFDMGANGVACNDLVFDDEAGSGPGGRAWNSGWYGRDDGVDTTSCLDATTLLKVGWNAPGEWQRYTIDSTPGSYNLNLRYAAGASGGQMHVTLNGVNISGQVSLPFTGDYTSYRTYTVTNLTVVASGPATLEVGCDSAGYDLLWFEFQPLGAPPLPPIGLTVTPGNSCVSLNWLASSGAGSYAVQRSTRSGGPYALLGLATSTSWHDVGLTNGTTYYYVLAATNANGLGANTAEISATPLPSLLPASWTARDVGLTKFWNGDAGEVGLAGSSSLAGGTYTLKGSGIDIWGLSDSFQFAYRAIAGDCALIVRVTSLQNTDPWAKAGLMFRETLQFDSPHVAVVLTAQNGAEMIYRPATSGASSSSPTAIGSAPQWLKLVRAGNTFTCYLSANGSNWSALGSSVSLPLATNLFVGLAVTAHNNLQLNTATFDNLAVSAQPPPAPAGLTATANTFQIALHWAPIGGAATYSVKRSFTSTGPFTTIATGLLANDFLDTGLTAGTNYYYKISASNLNGESPDSGFASALAQSPPRIIVAGSTGGAQLTFAWPSWATGFTLYSADNLSPPINWTPVTNIVSIQTNTLSVNLTPVSGSRFFRLSRP